MNTRHKKSKLGQTILRKLQLLIIVVLLIIIFVIMRGIFFRLQDERNVSKGIEALKSEVKKFDQENKDLNKLVKYFSSTEFQEKEIKEKLNLVKEGEKIVVIQGGKNNEEDLASSDQKINNKVVTIHASYYYWWKYFFGK